MMRPTSKSILAATGGITLAVVAWCGLALAQQRADVKARADQAPQDPDALVLIFPTGDAATSALRVDAMMPAEVAVGQDYQYKIRVTNLTRNLVLEGVKVTQTGAEGFAIEQSEPKATGNDDGSTSWTFAKLAPGESKEVKVTALGDKEGQAQTCIQVDYKPTLCVATKFTKPTISLTKAAPKVADICRPLELRYTVKNTGSGVARNVVVHDDLPEGLTSEKNAKIHREVGDLEPGQAREFSVEVQASKPGEYASRASASAEGDLHARSNDPTTKIVQAVLTTEITGPAVQYVGQPLTYQAHVKNMGDAPAAESKLRIDVDDACRLVRMSKSKPEGVTPEQSGKTLSWNLASLEPGDERTVSFTVVSNQAEELKHVATASSACALGGDLAKSATDTAEVSTAILTIPALRLEMIDRMDPVKVGDEEQYDIIVRNQGSGPDNNVQVKLMIPEQFEFVRASGSTKGKPDGQTLSFEPIETLGPNAKAAWSVILKAKAAGDVRTKVELSSDYLQTPVPELEPTRIIE